MAVLYLGAWPFAVLMAAAALLMQWEFYSMMQVGGLSLPVLLAGLATVAIIFSPLLPELLLLAGGAVLACLALSPFEKKVRVERYFPILLFGVFYPGSLLVGLVSVRAFDAFGMGGAAFLMALSVILFVWATDIGAYYVGKTVGRRKLIPRVSPNKTWEGSIGGLVLALLVAVAIAAFGIEGLTWLDIVVLALVCSIAGQIGDLVASSFKRATGVKDAGKLLPGHGGLLDRLDGLLLASPVAHLYLLLVLNL